MGAIPTQPRVDTRTEAEMQGTAPGNLFPSPALQVVGSSPYISFHLFKNPKELPAWLQFAQ